MLQRNSKTVVRIRKESDYYFAYFIELRRIIVINYIGAQIIDAFFNKNYAIDKIINLIKGKRKK